MKARLRRTELQMQYAQLMQPGNCPGGIYVSLSEQLERWNGVIFVRTGYYQGCVLHFEVAFPAEYPQRAPTVYFDKGSIVHPLVDPKDDRLALSSAFPSWDAQTDNMTKLLFFIKSIFKTFTLNKLNDGLVTNNEAWRLYQSNRPVFAKLAAQCATVSTSSNVLYGRNSTLNDAEKSIDNNDRAQPHRRATGFTFRELDETEMQNLRLYIFGD